MARRGENIHKRKDGRWEARILWNHTPEGKACYRYLYGKTYQEAKTKRNHCLVELKNAAVQAADPAPSRKITLEQAMQEWLVARRDSVKASTYANYVNLFERHIKPALGGCRLTALTSDQIDAFLKELLKSGRMDHTGGLSPKTVADIRSVLLMSLQFAKKRHYEVPSIDAAFFYPPTHCPEIQILTKEEQKKLEQVLFSSNDPFSLGILLALYSGLRIGEVCALQWGDLNLEEGSLHVTKTVIRIRDLSPNAPTKTKLIIDRPKTSCSVRFIPLATFLVEYMRQFQQEDGIYLLTGTSTLMEPRICLKKYKQWLKRAGIKDHSFHTLRHTFATRCVENEFDIKSLSELLGHANVSTTLQRYVHPSMESKRTQIERLASSCFQSHAEQSTGQKSRG